jgi:hypothetical protein
MSNTAPSVTPERILQFVWAFAPPLAIEAAIHHRVFDVLEKQPLALAELAQATGASARLSTKWARRRIDRPHTSPNGSLWEDLKREVF